MKDLSNKQKKDNLDRAFRMTYSLDLKLFVYDGENIILFGKDFVDKNRNKCKIVILGKEYDIKEKIKKSELKDYGIKEKDKEVEVILKRNEITDTSCMFHDCSSLIELDLSSFDTQNVTDMSCMFSNCYSLVKLDLSSFDT